MFGIGKINVVCTLFSVLVFVMNNFFKITLKTKKRMMV